MRYPGLYRLVRHELAPFNIAVTIVEPGTTGTNFGKNLVVSKPLDIYEGGPAGQIHAYFGNGSYEAPGDAAKTVRAILEAVDNPAPPLRLATGSDAYNAI